MSQFHKWLHYCHRFASRGGGTFPVKKGITRLGRGGPNSYPLLEVGGAVDAAVIIARYGRWWQR